MEEGYCLLVMKGAPERILARFVTFSLPKNVIETFATERFLFLYVALLIHLPKLKSGVPQFVLTTGQKR